jgi:hypothetical protein
MEDYETANKDKVLSKFEKHLKPYGFLRTKPTFFVRVEGDIVEFIHVYKFTFGPYLRVHFGNRHLYSINESVALNGPDTDRIESKLHILVPKRKYDLKYNEDEKSVEKCAGDMLKAYLNEGEKWFKKSRKKLKLSGSGNDDSVTRRLLGLDRYYKLQK